LDLHLLDLSATRWFDAALDCDARGCQAGLPWDGPGTEDDPVHDGNVMMGRGPEDIHIPIPVTGAPGYRVGVYYAYDAGGLGPADAFVRISCNGMLAAAYGPVTLVRGDLDDPDGLNSFWEVADVVFDMNGCMVNPLQIRMGGPLIVTSSIAHLRR